MTTSIRATLGSLRRFIVQGLAVIALLATYAVSNVGGYALSVVGLSTLAMTTTTSTPATAQWRRWRGRRWGWGRRWRRWRW